MTKDNIEKDLLQIENIINERKETEKYEPILKKFARIIIHSKKLIEQMDNKNTNPKTVLEEIQQSVSIIELNSLPNVFDEVKIQFAYTLRNLSVAIWNAYNDEESAITLIILALEIDTPNEIIEKLDEEYNHLLSFREEKKKLGKPIDSTPSLYLINGCGTVLYGMTQYFVILGIPIIPIARYSYEKISSSEYRFFGKLELNKFQKFWKYGLLGGVLIWLVILLSQANTSTKYYSKTSNNSLTKKTGSIQNTNNANSKYRGHQLKNGDSPFNNYFGKGIYNKNNENWIQVETDQYDVVVCLVDYSSERTIRNEYIRARSTFQMTNIPNGTYYIKGFFGKDWNPTKYINLGKIKGGFDTDVHFSKTSGSNSIFTLQDDGYQYSTIKIILYSVIDGNTQQTNINEDEFFK
ncbi:MAG: hypothetical protein AB7W47_03955 [Calditrichaceae bacterium]